MAKQLGFAFPAVTKKQAESQTERYQADQHQQHILRKAGTGKSLQKTPQKQKKQEAGCIPTHFHPAVPFVVQAPGHGNKGDDTRGQKGRRKVVLLEQPGKVAGHQHKKPGQGNAPGGDQSRFEPLVPLPDAQEERMDTRKHQRIPSLENLKWCFYYTILQGKGEDGGASRVEPTRWR